MSAVKLPYEEFDLSGVTTYPLASRASKVTHEDFAKPWDPSTGLSGWFDALPKLLAASDFRAVVAAVRRAHADGRALVWGLGAWVCIGALALGRMLKGLQARRAAVLSAITFASVMVMYVVFRVSSLNRGQFL